MTNSQMKYDYEDNVKMGVYIIFIEVVYAIDSEFNKNKIW